MKQELSQIGFGGGCHWCTEAYFQSLKGVSRVDQGWISSIAPDDEFSEAVVVNFNPDIISLSTLIEIHLLTHASTSRHSFREKYRSAIYTTRKEAGQIQQILDNLQKKSEAILITRVLTLNKFKRNTQEYQNYYLKNRNGVFCERYISPKLKLIEQEYANYFKEI